MTANTARKTGIPLVVDDEVAEAISEGLPVVALESNVISHGLPYPENAATAERVQEAVRAGGAVPATIAVDNGAIVVGMSGADIERFASTPDIPKVSSRDLPVILAQGRMGALTVAASVVGAELAGIPFFSSAGIGGVHRGADKTMDISSDLMQFTRSKVAVVCAGAKKILDLCLTLEFLETQCVPVVSYRSDDFPAFYCVSSGLRSPRRLDDDEVIARSIENHWALGNTSSFLITTPVSPDEAIDSDDVDTAIAEAIAAAERDGIRGQGITKYLMRAVDAATEGRSTKANVAVLVSTAHVGGRLAAAHAKYRSEIRG
ncbi:pseudouridine-5-phosphate glycosidase [Actinosynnema sp. ALI-1.44]|uniref:pseudouridine-5'-phosphate glycosidase n=1 Tax=Actinosynnema sp. ALI-1.44 TaxID=1933779 RepID=UPI00097C538C|nr:pseudouridine-5'-phosphate glycosidase [Actinosynnema sp. ALI-1.44]ONI81651.1 pseudouridine-5-phosphate glycosidase [Actinosynnema sp. ALI-1.44]